MLRMRENDFTLRRLSWTRKYETLTIDLKHENLVDNFFWENKSIERGSRSLRTPEIGAPYVI